MPLDRMAQSDQTDRGRWNVRALQGYYTRGCFGRWKGHIRKIETTENSRIHSLEYESYECFSKAEETTFSLPLHTERWEKSICFPFHVQGKWPTPCAYWKIFCCVRYIIFHLTWKGFSPRGLKIHFFTCSKRLSKEKLLFQIIFPFTPWERTKSSYLSPKNNLFTLKGCSRYPEHPRVLNVCMDSNALI